VHYPTFVFRSGSFTAPEWPKHEKYYCPHCEFLWSDHLDKYSLAEYGEQYVQANFESHRKPAEERMIAAPNLLAKLIRLTSGARFIDYGVGYNVPYVYELRGRGIDLWGCDISARVPYSRFIRYLPDNDLPMGTFDGLYSIDVAEHLSNLMLDYNTMKDLLKPGGYILHNTYWLHSLWKPGKSLPTNPMLRNPWHVSLCSERTMMVIAEMTGLEFVNSVHVKVGPGTAYLFRKPGRLPRWRLNHLWTIFSKHPSISLIEEHMKYVRKFYS